MTCSCEANRQACFKYGFDIIKSVTSPFGYFLNSQDSYENP